MQGQGTAQGAASSERSGCVGWLTTRRHDNDRKQPRTTSEIYMLNRAMAKKMEDVFLSKGIPVIPSIGAYTTD